MDFALFIWFFGKCKHVFETPFRWQGRTEWNGSAVRADREEFTDFLQPWCMSEITLIE